MDKNKIEQNEIDLVKNEEEIKKAKEIYKTQITIMLLGDSSVGKTTFVKTLTDSPKPLEHTKSEEVTELYYKINGDYFKVRLIDTSTESLREQIKDYLKLTDYIFYIYDISNKNSFDNIKNWVILSNEAIKIKRTKILIGNKSDLSDKRQVDEKTAKSKLEEYQMSNLYEISLNDKGQLKAMFEKLLLDIFLPAIEYLKKIEKESEKLENEKLENEKFEEEEEDDSDSDSESDSDSPVKEIEETSESEEEEEKKKEDDKVESKMGKEGKNEGYYWN